MVTAATPALKVAEQQVEFSHNNSHAPIPVAAWTALAVALLFWASAFAGIRVALRTYTPAHLGLLRYSVASLVLALYARFAHFRLPRRRDIPMLVLAGSLGITLYNLALNYGETRVTAGSASLLVSSTPIWAALLAMFILRERLSPAGWLGVLLSFAGVALIASGEGRGIHLAPQAVFIVAAAMAWGIYIIIQKHFLGRYSALEFTSYSVWSGTLLLAPFGRGLVHAVRSAPASATLAVLYLGVFPAAIASFAWAYALSHGPAGKMASFLYAIPVFATFIAWIWLGEVPRTLSLVGGAIAIAGVILVNLRGRSSTPSSPNLSSRAK